MKQIQQKPLPEDARYNMLHELGVKKVQFNTALAQALGLSIEAVVSNGDGIGTQGAMAEAVRTHSNPPSQANRFKSACVSPIREPIPSTVKDVRLVTTPDKDWKLAWLSARRRPR